MQPNNSVDAAAQALVSAFRSGSDGVIPSSCIDIWVNGTKHTLTSPNPDTTLLEFLRGNGYTGTKLGCGEGGCGACTVMVSSILPDEDAHHPDTATDASTKGSTRRPTHVSINACLAPLCAMDRCHVITSEGLGNPREGLHPVQQRIADLHGSQCGFCTPGIVMALYTILRNHPNADPNFVQEHMDGNLCRCTGYRPILDAAKSLCCGGGGGGSNSGNGNSSGGCGASGGCPCAAKKTRSSSLGESSGLPGGEIETATGVRVVRTTGDGSASLPCLKTSGPSEPIFPPPLAMAQPFRALWLEKHRTVEPTSGDADADGKHGGNGGSQGATAAALPAVESCVWVQPSTLLELCALKHVNPTARLIVGNTEVGIETKFKKFYYSMLVAPRAIPEMRALHVQDGEGGSEGGPRELVIGGACTLGRLEHFCADFEAANTTPAKDAGILNSQARGLVAIKHMLRWFASNQIRAGASLAGNLATASPISDMNPMLASMHARLKLGSLAVDSDGKAHVAYRWVNVRDFFLAYRKVDLQPSEVIVAVHLPLPEPNSFWFAQPYKQARRREDDISIVTCGFCVDLTPSSDNSAWIVRSLGAAFGGMGPTTLVAHKMEASLTGQPWAVSSLSAAYQALSQQDLVLPDTVPGGQPEYRRALPPSFLFKFFVKTSQDLALQLDALPADQRASLPPPPTLSPEESSASTNFVTSPKPPSMGRQEYTIARGGLTAAHPGQDSPPAVTNQHRELPESQLAPKLSDRAGAAAEGTRAPVGEPIAHLSAKKQVSGVADYVDDIPAPQGTLHAAPILATVPHAYLRSVDASGAYALNEDPKGAFGLDDGKVVRVCLAEDVSYNHIGAVVKDEEVFASINPDKPTITSVGQIIGVVVATTLKAAQAGALAVKVEVEEVPAILDVESAVAARSFYDNVGPPAMTTAHQIQSGNIKAAREAVQKALAAAAAASDSSSGDSGSSDLVVVTGEMRVGGQEHFYLEPNASLAVPSEGGEEMCVYSSTQNPVKTQNFTAMVLGLQANKVVCRMKRMGGGFGGKETRSVFVALCAAVAAQKCNAPVKICLDRDVDMSITGTRHPFVCKYTAAASKTTGKLAFLDCQLYSDGGCSLDLSGPIMDRALFHIDNVYKWPVLSVQGVVCKTNLPSNTAFRGFGGPQAMVFTETILEHLASELAAQSSSSSSPSPSWSSLELRQMNLYTEGELTHFDQPLVGWHVPRCIQEAINSSDYHARAAAVTEFNKANRWRKRGLSLVPTKFGISFTAKFMNQGGALVHVQTDGTVLVTHGGTEMGQGLHTKVCQVAAKVFGIPVDHVYVSETASDKVANASPSAASLSTDLYGQATLNACEEIRKRLEPIARALQESKGGAAPSFKEIAFSAYFQRVDLSAHGFYIVPADRCGYDWSVPLPEGASNSVRGTPFNYFTQGVSVSEVELDCLTGDVRILRADVVMDVGNSINPAIDIGQIEGAFVQGWGWLSMEELSFGDSSHKWVRPGHLFTKGPGTYKIPAFDDAPTDFRVRLLDQCANPFAVHSSKAIGEPPFFLATSAFLASKHAVAAARSHRLTSGGDDGATESASSNNSTFFPLWAPATSERLRMACLDNFTQAAVPGKSDAEFFPNGSY